MHGKTVVMTGATSGIGAVAARRLAQLGARIVFVARDPARAEETLNTLRETAPAQDHRYHIADLARLADVKRVAQLLADLEAQVDVLVNNAGAMFATRLVTEDGLERTFATNHIAYFVMTNLLLARLKGTHGARVVSTASAAHQRSPLDFSDLQSEHGYRAFAAYGRSKLMNILFTRELARRLAGTTVTANCLHPGFVATRFGDAAGGALSLAIRVAKRFAITAEQGAQTIVYLASSPEVERVSGKYFVRCKPVAPSPDAQSDSDAERLWDISARLSGVGV
jgi:NAD(P)-dependent dehydrogenase (short-subunit alcohol dehydrogenase family)